MNTIIMVALILAVADAIFLNGAIIINRIKSLIGK